LSRDLHLRPRENARAQAIRLNQLLHESSTDRGRFRGRREKDASATRLRLPRPSQIIASAADRIRRDGPYKRRHSVRKTRATDQIPPVSVPQHHGVRHKAGTRPLPSRKGWDSRANDDALPPPREWFRSFRAWNSALNSSKKRGTARGMTRRAPRP